MVKDNTEKDSRVSWAHNRIRGLASLAVHNPRWLAMFLLSRFEAVRSAQRIVAKPFVPTESEVGSALTAPVDLEAASQELDTEGFYTGLRLTDNAVDSIRSFASRAPCYGNADAALPINPEGLRDAHDDEGNPIVIGDYMDGVRDCEAIADLWKDPQLLEIAGRYLRAKPHLVRSRLWWSFPLDQEAEFGHAEQKLDPATFAQNRYHYDLHDWRTLKFFFYIYDVDEGCGPHLLIRRTHRNHKLAHQFSLKRGFSTDELLKSYGEENVVKMTGDAGFGFVEDPFGFHTGTPVTKNPRLILEVAYGVSKTPPADPHNAAI